MLSANEVHVGITIGLNFYDTELHNYVHII